MLRKLDFRLEENRQQFLKEKDTEIRNRMINSIAFYRAQME